MTTETQRRGDESESRASSVAYVNDVEVSLLRVPINITRAPCPYLIIIQSSFSIKYGAAAAK